MHNVSTNKNLYIGIGVTIHHTTSGSTAPLKVLSEYEPKCVYSLLILIIADKFTSPLI